MATVYNSFVIVAKAVTFVPLAALIYYSDYGKWLSYFYPSPSAGFIIVSFTLFGLGVILKRRAIATYLQTSKSNSIVGSVVLVSTAALYVVANVYFSSSSLLLYESLIGFGLSYVLLRSDSRLARLLLPLFLILGIAPLTRVLSQDMGIMISGLVVSLGLFGLFDAFLVGSVDEAFENLRLLVLPALIIGLGLGYWLQVFDDLVILVLVPFSLIALTLPRVGRFLRFSRVKLPATCPGHREAAQGGFCIICGQKYASIKSTTSSGLAGLFISIIVIVLLLTTQVPLLVISGSGPNISQYSYSGTTSQVIPQTPAGWLVNSSLVLDHAGNTYALKRVYVPFYHPETKNYTLYFEVAPPGTNFTSIVSNIISLGILPGVQTSITDMTLGDFTGSLTSYVSPGNSILIAFQGVTELRFANGSNFYTLSESVEYTRSFVGTNVSIAKSDVVSELTSVFIPLLQAQNYPHSWDDFLFGADETFSSTYQFLLMLVTSGVIVFGTFLVKQSDSKIDVLETRESDLTEQRWRLLSCIMQFRGPATTLEIGSYCFLKPTRATKFWDSLERTLEQLELKHVLERTLFERESEVLSGWQVSV